MLRCVISSSGPDVGMMTCSAIFMTRPSRHPRSARRPLNKVKEQDMSFVQPRTPLLFASNASTTITSSLSRFLTRGLLSSVTTVSPPALHLSGRRRVTAPIGAGSYRASEPAVAMATVGGGGISAVATAGPPVSRRHSPGELRAARRRCVVVMGGHDRDAPDTWSLHDRLSQQRDSSGARDADTKKGQPSHPESDNDTKRERTSQYANGNVTKQQQEHVTARLAERKLLMFPPIVSLAVRVTKARDVLRTVL